MGDTRPLILAKSGWERLVNSAEKNHLISNILAELKILALKS
jgi:hypothetical protein